LLLEFPQPMSITLQLLGKVQLLCLQLCCSCQKSLAARQFCFMIHESTANSVSTVKFS